MVIYYLRSCDSAQSLVTSKGEERVKQFKYILLPLQISLFKRFVHVETTLTKVKESEKKRKRSILILP